MFNVIIEDGWKTFREKLGTFNSKERAEEFVHHLFGDSITPGLLGFYWTFNSEDGKDSNCRRYITIEQA